MFRKRNTLIASLALVGAFGAAESASAQAILALVGDNTISMIDPASRKVTKSWPVKGADKLAGIDVRPADGMLYGVTEKGMIVTIDTKTGEAKQKAELSEKLAPGITATVDFNPAADRLRLMGSDGKNLRVNVDDGKATVDGTLKFAEADMHKGEKPNVVAGAYTNSVKGTKETALYDIDATIGALLKQAPPNDGVLNAVGKLGLKVSGPIAFNIVADGNGKNDAWLVSDGTLYAVDLESGKAKSIGAISNLKGTIRDIAWWPADAK
jgi:DNA-binding beta-propeller fold protein YncE